MPALSQPPSDFFPQIQPSSILYIISIPLLVLGIYSISRKARQSHSSQSRSAPNAKAAPEITSPHESSALPEKYVASWTNAVSAPKRNASEFQGKQSAPNSNHGSLDLGLDLASDWERDAGNGNAKTRIEAQAQPPVYSPLPFPLRSKSKSKSNINTTISMGFELPSPTILSTSPTALDYDFPPSSSSEEDFPPRRRSYTKTIGVGPASGREMSGEIVVSRVSGVEGQQWRRHTRVFGGGVCKACEESERRMSA